MVDNLFWAHMEHQREVVVGILGAPLQEEENSYHVMEVGENCNEVMNENWGVVHGDIHGD